MLAIVGAVNVPIIYYSVIWWNTLHQPPSLTMGGRGTIDASMVIPLLVLALAFKLFYVTVLFIRTRCELLERERNSTWVQELAPNAAKGG